MTERQPRPGAARPGRRSGGARPGPPSRSGPSWSTPRSASAATPRRCSSAARRRTSIGIDRDVHALDRSRERLAPYGERVTFVHAVYDEIADVLDELGHPYVDGVLFDLGVSSMQLDLRERGFAYSQDAPLDMRMDDTDGPTAADVLNEYPVEELARILKHYGEERFARRIAEAVVREREQGALHHLGAARRAALRLDPGPGPAHRGTPRQADVPGAAHRGQRRARRAAPGDPGRHRRRSGSAGAWWS